MTLSTLSLSNPRTLLRAICLTSESEMPLGRKLQQKRL